MDYVIETRRLNENHAGIKAPDDVVEICKKNGFKTFTIPLIPKDKHKNKLYIQTWLFIHCVKLWMTILFTVKSGDRVVWQHPAYGIRYAIFFIPLVQKMKKVSFIALIHDLESLRGGIAAATESEKKRYILSDLNLLEKFDFVISHNLKMSVFLESIGINSEKIVNLEVFDYLYDGPNHQNTIKDEQRVVIAGNLSKLKSSYIYEFMEEFQAINLYGILFEGNQSDSRYKGVFNPEDLIINLQGTFGLVWDGNSLEKCSGNTGEYLKYNNPHKFSLYLAARLPIIIWEKAALSKFVLENKIGLVVSNLHEVKQLLENLDSDEYQLMLENVSRISEKVRNGYYLTNALEKCKKYEN